MGRQFGEFLRKLREDRNMTLRDVEEKIHISNSYLSQVESGQRSIPTVRILSKLAECYGCKVEALTNAAEGELKKERIEKFEPPSVEAEYIYRVYSRLSMANKYALRKFLQYLESEERDR